MAVTTPAPAAAPAPAAPPAAGQPAPRPGRRRRRGGPAALRALLVLLVASCLAWGGVATWTVIEHASAAGDVVTTSEPLSLRAQQMYRSLADADVTVTTAFLGGPQVPLAARQRYAADIAQAAADLAALKGAASAAGNQRLEASLAEISGALPLYTGYVAQAQTEYATGYQLTGSSFIEVASEQMHLTLLPAARASYARENARLADSSAQATGLPWIVAVVAAALLIGYLLIRTQRWLTRRTHRVVNFGLLAATVVLGAGTAWLVIAFLVARGDLNRASAHGSAPAETLAQAGIIAAQARGDEVLNLISRSGDATFEGDFRAASKQLGPGPGSLLTRAADASRGDPGGQSADAATRDAPAWYAVHHHVYQLDQAANYAAETKLVIGAGSGSSGVRYSHLQRDLSRAIGTDQGIFHRGATAGRGAFSGLEVGIIVAALLMAAGCAWGLARRLAEYR